MSIYTSKLLNHLLTSDTELREIYNLRNVYLDFNTNSDYNTAKTKLDKMIILFNNHQIPEIREYGRTLKRWKSEILNSFIKHGNSRYSNGRIEGKNRDIKTIIRNGYGLKNFRRFRARVLYLVNKNIEIKISNKYLASKKSLSQLNVTSSFEFSVFVPPGFFKAHLSKTPDYFKYPYKICLNF